MKKLLSNKGETLTETLVSLIIMTLASIILATLLVSSSRIIGRAKEYDEALNNELNAAELGTGSSSGLVTITVKGEQQTEPVTLTGTAETLMSYRRVSGP